MPRSPILTGVVIGMFLSQALADGGEQKADSYTFTLNGKPLKATFIHVDGTPEQPAAGDLIQVDMFSLVLGSQRNQTYHAVDYEEGVLWIEGPDGKRRPAAVRVCSRYSPDADGKYTIKRDLNPFQHLKPDEIRQLRSVVLERWSDDLKDALTHLDPERVHVFVSSKAAVGPERRFPPLPAKLRYLFVDDLQGKHFGEREWLSNFKDLHYLEITVRGQPGQWGPVDCERLLAHALRHLTIRARGLKNVEALRKLTELRYLDLSYNRDLNTVAFVAQLKKLESLDVSMTAVRDFRPLAGHPTLREIDATWTQVEKLPLEKPLPQLRVLRTVATDVSEADALAFAKLHPKCQHRLLWLRPLLEALEGADRLRVRTGGTCHRDIPEERTLYEEKDRAKVRDFVQLIKIDEKQSGGHCLCCGEPSFEFYKEGKLILTLGYHHGQSVRWREGWPGDGELTQASARSLQRWLADHVTEIKLAQEAARIRQQQEAAVLERFLSHFPEKVRPLLRDGGWVTAGGPGFDKGDQKLADQIAAAFPDEKMLAVAVCRALGTADGSWSISMEKERRVLAAVNKVSGAKFQDALETLKDDRSALLGASRLFFFQKLDQRLSPEARLDWAIRLGEIVLQDGVDRNKSTVLDYLSRCNDLRTGALLREVMLGKQGKELTEDDFEEPGVRSGAALALAKRKEKNLKPDVEKLHATGKKAADVAALQVALALLGDPAQLRVEHFELRSFAIGLGAIQAIEQFRGMHGLELLVEKGMDHPWASVRDEAELAIQRITGQNWPRRDRRDAIRAWWKAHGPTFIEQRRKEQATKQ